MIKDGMLADIVRFNSVINAFAQKDDGESAASWLSRMINEGLLPDIAHCATQCPHVEHNEHHDDGGNKRQVLRTKEQGVGAGWSACPLQRVQDGPLPAGSASLALWLLLPRTPRRKRTAVLMILVAGSTFG